MSDRIYKVLDTYLSKGGVGVTISVSVAGDRIQTFSAGEADRGKKIAVRLTHLFRIGSCTKTFVSAAILHMADKGPEPGLFASSYAGRLLLGHQGSMPGYVSVMQHDPSSELTVAMAPNLGSGNRISFQASGLHSVVDEVVTILTEPQNAIGWTA